MYLERAKDNEAFRKGWEENKKEIREAFLELKNKRKVTCLTCGGSGKDTGGTPEFRKIPSPDCPACVGLGSK